MWTRQFKTVHENNRDKYIPYEDCKVHFVHPHELRMVDKKGFNLDF